MSHSEKVRFLKTHKQHFVVKMVVNSGLSCRQGPAGKGHKAWTLPCVPCRSPSTGTLSACLHPDSKWHSQRRSSSPHCPHFNPQHRHHRQGGWPCSLRAQKRQSGSYPLILSSIVLVYGLERQTLTPMQPHLSQQPSCGPVASHTSSRDEKLTPHRHPEQLTLGRSSSSWALASLRRKEGTWAPGLFPRVPCRMKPPACPCSSPTHNLGG